MWSWLTGLQSIRDGRVGYFSRGLLENVHLGELLGARQLVYRPSALTAMGLSCVVCWGRRPSTTGAERFAHRYRLPLHRLEDGFVRSLGLGVDGATPCSLVRDPLGIYYDATRVSQLEAWLGDPAWSPVPQLVTRAERCMRLLREQRISKYNHTQTEPSGPPFDGDGKVVLVVDQTHGDQSIALGCVPSSAFDDMVTAALAEHPDARVVIKVHPDVLRGRKRGCAPLDRKHERLFVSAQAVNPIALLERVQHVYVATSQLGFEALMLGKPVTCFGLPFYAGWGLTDDRVTSSSRTMRRSVAEIFVAAYFEYSRYVDPRTGRRCELEQLVDALVQQRGTVTALARQG
jgi:capsular polysaccharide export protein